MLKYFKFVLFCILFSLINVNIVFSLPQCFTLPSTSVCASILNYGAVNFQVNLLSDFSCVNDAEKTLSSLFQMLGAIETVTSNPPVSPIRNSTYSPNNPYSMCGIQYARLLCEVTYPPCNTPTTTLKPCTTTCNTVFNSACSHANIELAFGTMSPYLTFLFGETLANSNLNCTSNPSTTVYSSSTTCNHYNDNSIGYSTYFPGRCEPYTGSVCKDIVNYNVFVPSGYSQSLLEGALQEQMALLRIATRDTLCLPAVGKFVCGRTFSKCSPVSIQPAAPVPPLLFPLPSQPCQNPICTEVFTQCSDLIEEVSGVVDYFDCFQSTVIPPYQYCGNASNAASAATPAYPDFPTSSTQFVIIFNNKTTFPLEIAGTNLVTQCNNNFNASNQISISSLEANMVCPSPLVVPDSLQTVTLLGGSCALPCESFEFLDSEWQAADGLYIFCSVVSFLLMTFMWLTWTIFPSRRKQHHLHMFFTCQWIFSVVFLFALADDHNRARKIGCINNAQAAVQSDGGYCLFQAIAIVFVINSTVSWWFIIAFDLFLKVVLEKKFTIDQTKKMNYFYHGFTWGLSFLFTIIGLGGQWLGRSTTVPWCFVADSAPSGVEWGIFYYPVMLRGIVGAIMMVAVMYKMVSQARKTHSKTSKRGKGLFRHFCGSNMRPIMFVTEFLFIFALLVVYRAYLYFNNTVYTNDAETWFSCLLVNGPDLCPSRPASHPNVGLWFLVQICVAGEGILTSLLYIWQPSLFALWYGLLKGKGLNYTGKMGDSSAASGTSEDSRSRTSETDGALATGDAATSAKGTSSAGHSRQGSRSSIKLQSQGNKANLSTGTQKNKNVKNSIILNTPHVSNGTQRTSANNINATTSDSNNHANQEIAITMTANPVVDSNQSLLAPTDDATREDRLNTTTAHIPNPTTHLQSEPNLPPPQI